MKIFDLISMCIRNLFRRKVRTFLTVTGVVVGTCAIVVMVSLGLGMQANTEAMLAQMGDLTIIEVYNFNAGTGGGAKLTDATLAEFAKIEHVEVATPLYIPNGLTITIQAGGGNRYEAYPTLVGIYPQAMEKLGYKALSGSMLSEDDKPYTMVLGQYASYSFRDTRKRAGKDMIYPEPDAEGNLKPPFVDAAKEKLKIVVDVGKENVKPLEFTPSVVGTIQEDFSKGWETREGVFMDVADLKAIVVQSKKAAGQKLAAGDIVYDQAKIKVDDMANVKAVDDAIKAMGFENTFSMESIRAPMQKQAQQQQMILGGLGAISLFVAALGITNTMIMSIYERTREIGVMKVLGCFVGNIRTVFLMEAGSIGFLGGVLGVCISEGISLLMNYLSMRGAQSGGADAFGGMVSGGTAISIIPLWLVVCAVGFATVIGLVSGFTPANRAVKISALEAIKHEQ